MRPEALSKEAQAMAPSLLLRGAPFTGRTLFALHLASVYLKQSVPEAISSGEVLVLGGDMCLGAEAALSRFEALQSGDYDSLKDDATDIIESLKSRLSLCISMASPHILVGSSAKNKRLIASARSLAELREEISYPMAKRAGQSLIKNIRKELDTLATAGSLGIDQIRAAEEWVRTTPGGEAKILVIRSLEQLSESASNSLLKLLEEPPRYARIICTTTERSAILPTLLSRLHVVYMPRLSAAQEQGYLKAYHPGSQAHSLLDAWYELGGVDVGAIADHVERFVSYIAPELSMSRAELADSSARADGSERNAGDGTDSARSANFRPKSAMELSAWLGAMSKAFVRLASEKEQPLPPALFKEAMDILRETTRRLQLNISVPSAYEWTIAALRSLPWK